MARSAPPPVMTLLAVPPPTPTAPVVSPPTPVATQAAPPPRVLTIPPPNLAPPARPPPVASPIPAVTPSPGLIAVIPFSPPPPQTRTPPPPQQSSGPTAMTVLSPPLVSSPVITPVATQQPPPIPVATQQPPPLPIPSQQPPPAPVATQQPPPLPIPPQQPPPIPVATQQPPAAQLPALSSNMTALLPLSTQQLVLKAPVPAPSPMLLTISAPLSSPAGGICQPPPRLCAAWCYCVLTLHCFLLTGFYPITPDCASLLSQDLRRNLLHHRWSNYDCEPISVRRAAAAWSTCQCCAFTCFQQPAMCSFMLKIVCWHAKTYSLQTCKAPSQLLTHPPHLSLCQQRQPLHQSKHSALDQHKHLE